MRTRESLTISLPPEMLEEVERVRKAEHRSRSELIREALRFYFRGREETPTPAELRAIRRGRKEITRGEFVTADTLFNGLDAPRRKERRKGARARQT